MRNLGSKLFVLIVAALLVAGLGYAFMPRPVEIDIVKVDRGSVRVTVDEDGKTRIREKYVVSAPLNGRILRINLDPGDKVEAGKTLLTSLEPRDPELLDARTIAQSEARVKASEATLRRAEPELEKARSNQAFYEAELARQRQAFQGGGITRSELESAEMLSRQASEGYRSSKVAEDIARFELEQARAALMRSRPQSPDSTAARPERVAAKTGPGTRNGNAVLPDTGPISDDEPLNEWEFPIYAPIDGKVLRVFQESSAVVMPGTSLVQLGDPTDLEVEIDVLSRDAAKIRTGNLVLFEHWGGAAPLHGRVRVIEPSGFTKISTLGVEEQRVWIICDIEETPAQRPNIADGFRVEARIVIDEAQNALRVPTSSLFRAGDDPAVFRVVEGVVHTQKVKVGRQNGLEAEILEGLSEGDQVVLHPSDQVDNGVKVKQRGK
jgi:HlyD family secretion protein